MTRDFVRNALKWAVIAGFAMLPPVSPAPVQGQTYDSGSTGADGPMIFSTANNQSGGKMVYDSVRDRIVLFGIEGATWEWDNLEWKVISGGGPQQRSGYSMAFDPIRGRTVLFGGYINGSTLATDTWEWDGADWTQRLVPGPPGRAYSAMCASQNGIILFGGQDASYNFMGDTWEWDGTSWTEVSTTGPPARYYHAMSYDSVRQRPVLFGGYALSGYRQDTWEWDGANWVEVSTGGPPPRQDHGLAFDVARAVTVLWGGFGDNDTWEWDGTNWVQRAMSSPSPRSNFCFSYSPAGRVTLYGGGEDTMFEWDGDGGIWKQRGEVGFNAKIIMSDHPDGIYNLTELRIPSNIQVSVVPNEANTPLVILATGDVVIDGNLDVSGQSYGGVGAGNEAKGGPGGYRGGAGGVRFDVSGYYGGGPGLGPGGGGASENLANAPGNGGGYATSGSGSDPGEPYGNIMIQPLIGGSGGGGSSSGANYDGSGGGGGGGAVLIASSSQITVNGYIHAIGGDAGGAGGSGGAIRLVAPNVDGLGYLYAYGGYGSGGQGGEGRIRVEGYVITLPPTYTNPPGKRSLPYPPFPETVGTISITNVAGQVVPPTPQGRLDSPDIIFTENGPITIDLATTNIPEGTILKVRITSGRSAQVVDSTPVAANGTATATATVPEGVGTIIAHVDYGAL